MAACYCNRGWICEHTGKGAWCARWHSAIILRWIRASTPKTSTCARSNERHVPLDYHQDDVQRLVTVTPHGVVTIDESLDVLRQQIANEAWSYGTLYDARGREDSLTPTDVRRLSDFVNTQSTSHGPIGPLAILAPADVTFGMGRLFQIISDEVRQIAVFRDVEVARGWLHQLQRQPHQPPGTRPADET